MDDHINNQVIELYKIIEENEKRAKRKVKTETHHSGLDMSYLLKHPATLLRCIQPICWQKFESSWYFLSTETKTWEKSREDCVKRGADLVIINSNMEQTFLFNLEKRVWIGLTDSVNEGTWKWVDDTPLTTRYWYDPQPDNGGGKVINGEEHCVEIRTDQSLPNAWNDLSCAENLHWICEKVF
uniref:C-type lectin domain-containing protein n=1 Tax=Salmo trutta TaxID=8032 RepID=A0A673Y9J5_SALTR